VRWWFQSPMTIILKWIINQWGNMVSMAFLIRLYGWLLWTWYWMLGFQNDSGFFDQARDYNLTVHSVGWNVLCTHYIVEYVVGWNVLCTHYVVEYINCYIDYILNFSVWMDMKLSWFSRWVRASLLYDRRADKVPVLHLNGRSPRAECRICMYSYV
jgi:hypothetical protein